MIHHAVSLAGFVIFAALAWLLSRHRRQIAWRTIAWGAALQLLIGLIIFRDFLDQVIVPFNARLSTPLVPTVRAIYADGDMVIVLWDGAAIAKDGKSYENTYSWYLKMRNGKIISATAFFDSIAFNDLWKRVRPNN